MLDCYAVYTLVFVLCSPMLSMVTTRRGEGVLIALASGVPTLRPLATLAAWTVIAVELAYKCFRWEDRR